MAIDVHSYGNEWIYPYASDLQGERIKGMELYEIYRDVISELKANNRSIQSCSESLGYIADGVVFHGLCSISIGHSTRELLLLRSKLGGPLRRIYRFRGLFRRRCKISILSLARHNIYCQGNKRGLNSSLNRNRC